MLFLALFLPPAFFSLADVLAAGEKGGGLGICCTHMLNSYSTQKNGRECGCGCALGSLRVVVETAKPSLSQSITHCIKHAQTRSQSPLRNADFSFWPTHAAQQQQKRALCSYLTRLLVLLRDASTAHTSLHHFHYTSSPSKSLSFLLLITVVGPFELFKAARAARKDPQCSQKR